MKAFVNNSKLKKVFGSNLMSVLIAYIAISILFSILSPYFFTWKNFQSILKFASTMGIVACGMTFILCAGCMDLSAGTTGAFAGVAVAVIIQKTDNMVLAIVASLGFGILCGLLNAFLINTLKIVPFIATLATQNIFSGLAYVICSGAQIPIRNKAFNAIAQTRVYGFPLLALYFLIVCLITGFVLKNTAFGRRVLSVGGNSEASFLAGIDIRRTKTEVYVLMGFLSAFSGILNASLAGVGSAAAMATISMDAIAATILGGCTLGGGKGTMIGTLIGVLIYATMANGMALLSIPSFYQTSLKGVILIFAVTIDLVRNSGKGK